jgi:hypothetical protein
MAALSSVLRALRDDLLQTQDYQTRHKHLLHQLDAACHHFKVLEEASDEIYKHLLRTFQCFQPICETILANDHFKELRLGVAQGVCSLHHALRDALSPAPHVLPYFRHVDRMHSSVPSSELGSYEGATPVIVLPALDVHRAAANHDNKRRTNDRITTPNIASVCSRWSPYETTTTTMTTIATTQPTVREITSSKAIAHDLETINRKRSSSADWAASVAKKTASQAVSSTLLAADHTIRSEPTSMLACRLGKKNLQLFAVIWQNTRKIM